MPIILSCNIFFFSFSPAKSGKYNDCRIIVFVVTEGTYFMNVV